MTATEQTKMAQCGIRGYVCGLCPECLAVAAQYPSCSECGGPLVSDDERDDGMCDDCVAA